MAVANRRLPILAGLGLLIAIAAGLWSLTTGVDSSEAPTVGNLPTTQLEHSDDDWIAEMTEPVLVEFRRPLTVETGKEPSSVLVSEVETLGSAPAEVIQLKMQELKEAYQQSRLNAQSLMEKFADLSGIEGLEKYIEAIAYEIAAEVQIAAVAMLREGAYITSKERIHQRLLPEGYRPVWTTYYLPTNELIHLMIPVDPDKFPTLRDIVDYHAELKSIVLENRVSAFNIKSYDDRKALVDHDREISNQIAELPKDLPDRPQRLLELLRKKLLPPGLIINMNTYLARAR